jgi:membrane protease YdiL (CAAX protease family)
VTVKDLLHVLFSVAFVVMAAVALGAILVGEAPPRDYQAGAVLLVFMGVGAGLWLLADWRRPPK